MHTACNALSGQDRGVRIGGRSKCAMTTNFQRKWHNARFEGALEHVFHMCRQFRYPQIVCRILTIHTLIRVADDIAWFANVCHMDFVILIPSFANSVRILSLSCKYASMKYHGSDQKVSHGVPMQGFFGFLVKLSLSQLPTWILSSGKALLG